MIVYGKMLQLHAFHAVNAQRVAAQIHVARVVDVAVDVQIRINRYIGYDLRVSRKRLDLDGQMVQGGFHIGIVGHS